MICSIELKYESMKKYLYLKLLSQIQKDLLNEFSSVQYADKLSI